MQFVPNGSCLCLKLFYSKWLVPQSWCTCSIPKRICTQILYSSFLTYLGGLCLHIQFPKDMCTSMVVVVILGRKLTQGAFQTCIGVFSVIFDLWGSPWWCMIHWRKSSFWDPLGNCVGGSDSRGSFLGDSNSWGSFLGDFMSFDPLRGIFVISTCFGNLWCFMTH